jgi:choice-of-anchor B domain-containing protein
MMKIFTLFSFSFFTLVSAFGQMQANLLGNWQDDDLIVTSWLDSRYNEVWGIEVNGVEYGIIGSTEGVHIIDLSDPTNPTEIHRVDGTAIGDYLVHRDYKTYAGYLYCVADEGFSSTLQIIDLNDLPNSATQVYSSSEFVVTAHNIFIDEDNARLYIIGDGNSVRILDISTPDQPVLLADNNNTFIPYAHDAYVRDNIAYLNCAFDGLWVVDFNDPQNPVVLGTMDNYPEAGYNHAGWLSDDGQYYFLCDETHGTSVKTVDVSDPSDMSVVALFRPGNWSDEIAHNAIVRGDRLYVSYYYDGLTVWDISDPVNPELIAYHDTFCEQNEAFYAGMWGVYPLLPSGNILGSDMQTGLYVFESLPEVTMDLYLTADQPSQQICEGGSTSFDLELGPDFSPNGITLSDNAPAGVTVEFSSNPAQPGETVTATVSLDLGSSDPFTLEIFGDDGQFGVSSCFSFSVEPAANMSVLLEPEDNAEVMTDMVEFDWVSVLGTDDYEFQVADNTADFEDGLLLSKTVQFSNYVMTTDDANAIQSGDAPYHWRVLTRNDCGDVPTGVQVFSFMANAAGELNGAGLNVYPSPATDQVFVQFDQAINESLRVELTSLTGRVLSQNDFAAGENTLTLDVSDFAAGIYILKITDGEAAHVQRVVVK